MPNFSKHKSRINNLLTVLGTRCRIFPIDNDTLKAETLVPWMNDQSILIDKYDARCWLTEIGSESQATDKYVESPSLEALCEEERYFDLLKLHEQSEPNNTITNSNISLIQSNYEIEKDEISEKSKQGCNGEFCAVPFSYEEIKVEEITDDAVTKVISESEEDIPYQCPSDLIIPDNIELPETEKQAAKIEKTAAFIANNGTQMEILVKTKQSKNDQFEFLNYDNKLNPFYKFLLEKIKTAEYVPAKRQLCHLTKRDDIENSKLDSIKILPKIDISNTPYFKLINKYRCDNPKITEESPQNGTTNDCNRDNIATEESSTSETKPNDEKCVNVEEIEKLYTALYEQYYTYYYNYYYQLHTNTALSQDSSNIRIEEDSKSMAINAAVYAAKAGVEQYQKEQEEKARIQEQKVASANKKKQHCMIIRYVHYLVTHGEEFEFAMMKNGDKLKFLDSDNPNHNFYQQCLKRAKKTVPSKAEEKVVKIVECLPFPKWEDYIKKPSTGIQCAPKLLLDNHKSCITTNVEEQKLVEIVDMISSLLNAEKIGRDLSVPQVVDVKATRKRKATEFLEKFKEKSGKLSESDYEKRRVKSKKSSSSKKRKHRHR